MVAHKKGKKKSKKQHGLGSEKEVKDSKIHAEIIDEESEYPTSRVIKRAPNGDVIVESLSEQDSGDGSDSHNDHTGPTGALGDTVEDVDDTKWPIKLDTHWESLSLEERRNILRISKEELFEMIKSYKNVHSCDCSMCGRNNNMNIEQEIEQIYGELYDAAKYEDSETDFVQFHLKLIKEYQSKGNDSSYLQSRHLHNSSHKGEDCVGTTNSGDNIDNSSNNEEQTTAKLPKNSNTDSVPEDSNDELIKSLNSDYPIKYWLSEEVLAAEKADELKYMSKDDVSTNSHPTFTLPSNHSPASLDWKQEIKQFKSSKQKQLSESDAPPSGDLQGLQEVEQSSTLSPSYGEVDSKLMTFAKTLVSSHPHIAEEFINRAIMYPHIKAITEDMMNNEGEGLIKAMESLVLQQQHQNENEDALSQYEATSSEGGDLENSSQDNNSEENDDDDTKKRDDSKTIDTVSATGSTEIDALINNVNFDFVKDPDSVSSLIGAFYDVINNKDRRLEIDKDDREHKEELERLRNEISAAESHESYDWSNDEYEEGSEQNEPEDDYIDDEDIDDHHLDSEYDDDADDDDDDDAIYDDIDENVKHNKESYPIDHGHGSLIDRHHKSPIPNDSDECIDDDYDSEIDHAERLEEGRRLIQIAITKLLQKKLIASYQEKEAEKNRERLLMELEAEENQKKEREKRKQKKKEKEKEKKRLQQLAKEEEKKRQEEEELRLKKEAEEKELARREAQRKKVEEAKRKSDEKRKKKLAEQRRREEEQERIRKEKEELKKQREEEQKQKRLEKEKKQRELEEQRQQKKKLEELQKQQQQQQIETTIKNQEHSPVDLSKAEVTPYNLITNDVFHSNTTLNDDIFNMINQASKSMSSSPSRVQDNALDSTILTSGRVQNTMSTEEVLIPPSSTYSLPNTSPHAQGTYSQHGSALPLNSLGGWEQSQSSHVYYNNQNPSVEVANSIPPYTDGNVGVPDEVSNITNFLKDTTINDIPMTSKSSLSQPLEPLSISPRPQSAVYNQPALWSNDATQRINRFNHQQAQSSQLSSSQQRRSIWDSASDSTFAVNSNNGFGSNIWGSTTPIPAATATMLSPPQVTETTTESYMDVLTNCYKLLSPDNSFVPLDKLYQASLTQINAKSVLSYSQFVSTLMSMKKLNKCELLNDNTGMLAYCRMGGPMSAGLPAYSQGSYSGATSHAAVDTQSIGAIPTNTATATTPTNPLAQSLNSIFGDVSFSHSVPAVPAPVSQMDGISNTNPDPANYLHYDQSFPVSYQGSNIWS